MPSLARRANRSARGAARGFGSWVRSPGGGEQQLVILGLDQRPELARERHERRIGEHRLPEPPAVGIVGELPQMHDLVQRPDVADEVADEPALRMPAERGPAFALVKLRASASLPTYSE